MRWMLSGQCISRGEKLGVSMLRTIEALFYAVPRSAYLFMVIKARHALIIRLEFGISVRPEIACSRVTRFDRIQHTLHGSILAPPPGYTSLSPSLSHPSERSSDSQDVSNDNSREDRAASGCAISARASRSCPSSGPSILDGDAPPYEAASQEVSTSPDETRPDAPIDPLKSAKPHQHSATGVDTVPGLLARWKTRFFHPRPSRDSASPASHSGISGRRDTKGLGEDGKNGILARFQRVVPLWSLDISGEYNWTHSQTVPKLGGAGVRLGMTSEAVSRLSSTILSHELSGHMV